MQSRAFRDDTRPSIHAITRKSIADGIRMIAATTIIAVLSSPALSKPDRTTCPPEDYPCLPNNFPAILRFKKSGLIDIEAKDLSKEQLSIFADHLKALSAVPSQQMKGAAPAQQTK